MTREQLIAALREIASVLTVEIDRSGDNESRYRALKQAEKLALETLAKSDELSARLA